MKCDDEIKNKTQKGSKNKTQKGSIEDICFLDNHKFILIILCIAIFNFILLYILNIINMSLIMLLNISVIFIFFQSNNMEIIIKWR